MAMATDCTEGRTGLPMKQEVAEVRSESRQGVVSSKMADNAVSSWRGAMPSDLKRRTSRFDSWSDAESNWKAFGTTFGLFVSKPLQVDSGQEVIRTNLSPQFDLIVVPQQSKRQPELDATAERIIRKHFVETLLEDLRQIQEHSGQPSAANYAKQLFTTLRQARNVAACDPFLPVLMALHDALAYNNAWADYSSSQFEGARRVIGKYANQPIYPAKAEKAIMELEDLGFDTTPISVLTADAE